MQSLQTWFTGSAPDKEPAASSSVLSDWKNYSGGGAGGVRPAAAASTSDRLLANAEEGASTGAWTWWWGLAKLPLKR